MWVYQEPEIQPIEKGPITPPPSLPPVPEQEPLPAIVQSTPETTVPHIPETEVLSRTAPASHRERSAPHQGCVLLAGSYLSGAFTAGILQALLDTAEMDMLSYYLRCWRGLFAVQSASQIAQLFGTELLTILGVLCVLLLLGLSAIGPVPIYLFTMLYGAGAGLLTFQLFSGIPLPQALFFLFISGIPAALAAGALCWFGSCALEVSGRLHAFSLGRGRSPKERAVFITRRRKERISNRRVEQLITGAMKAAGLKGFSTHKLRHTAATLMYQTGNVDILTLKQLLGHSSVGTTQIYTHLQEFQVRAAIEQNPLGSVEPKKKTLDTTEAKTGENRETLPPEEDSAEMPSGPMEAFDGAAQDGFRVDVSGMLDKPEND